MRAYHLYLPSLIIAVLTPLGLAGLSHLFIRRRIKKVYYPVALIGVGLIGLAALYIADPSLLQSMLDEFGIFTPSARQLTILEVQPLLFVEGHFSFVLAWSYFTTGFFLSFISLGVLVYLAVKQGEPDKVLFVMWSLSMLAAILGQRRFGYYFAVNVALLTAYLSVIIFLTIRFIIDYLRHKRADYHFGQILRFAGFTGEPEKAIEIPDLPRGKKALAKKWDTGIKTNRIRDAAAVLIIFFLVFLPNINLAVATASEPRFVPDDAWYETLTWVKENTPEPFGDPQAYYEFYDIPRRWGEYEYPESAYGVISWWDYGHWIARIAHRIPVSNPFQRGIRKVSEFFTAQDENAANEIISEVNSRYIVIDYLTTVGKFHNMAIWAGRTQEDFSDLFYQRVNGRLKPIHLFYPTYYQSLAVRLYNFNGDGVTAERPVVISYVQKTNKEGHPYKEITSSQTFASYEEAEAYLSSQKSKNYIMVGTNPFLSPVPLGELNDYKLIYSSSRKTNAVGIGRIPLVKVFEYSGQ
jgi:dolichyl-diphosphooligosaccharide--protein glycosyltransferase